MAPVPCHAVLPEDTLFFLVPFRTTVEHVDSGGFVDSGAPERVWFCWYDTTVDRLGGDWLLRI